MKCWNCESEKDFETKKSLRMHQISSGEYDKEEFNKKIQELETDKDGESSESSSNNSSDSQSNSDGTSGDNNSDTDSSSNIDNSSNDELIDVSSEETTDLDDLISEDGNSDSSSEDSTSEPTRKGLDSAINDGWGRIATIDLDPEEEETTNTRKNIAGLAEDVGLGQNVKWYYEEELKGDTDDPKKALMGSLIMAMVMTLTVRPELAQKIQKEVKKNKSSTPDTTEDKEDE